MTTSEAIEILNEKIAGWSSCGTLICNPNDGGGIIDTNIMSGKWFVIGDHSKVEGIDALSQAVEWFINES